ncbi:hypothetical protein B0T09DRAFT_397460 [Sordaria sp. MPI-SDFR-AT-0083]|nr:hypothetical protein B0T09DRAFT_397460 [Sordaria sp. MPI-SDFR-AT-0083]
MASSPATTSSTQDAQTKNQDQNNLLEITNSTAIPRTRLSDYYSTIPRTSYSSDWAGYLFPCTYTDSLPDWSFFLGSAPETNITVSSNSNKAEPKMELDPEPQGEGNGMKEDGFYYKGTVPGRYMNYGEANATWCYGGMQSSEDIGFSVFGGVLLKAQFVVFDLGGMRVGFAGKDLLEEEGMVGKGEVRV